MALTIAFIKEIVSFQSCDKTSIYLKGKKQNIKVYDVFFIVFVLEIGIK